MAPNHVSGSFVEVPEDWGGWKSDREEGGKERGLIFHLLLVTVVPLAFCTSVPPTRTSTYRNWVVRTYYIISNGPPTTNFVVDCKLLATC